MSVAHGDDVYRQGRTGLRQALVEGLLCHDDTFVEAVFYRLPHVEVKERLVQGIQQARSGGVVFIQLPEHAQRHAGRGYEIASGLVNLHDFRLAHHDRLPSCADPTM